MNRPCDTQFKHVHHYCTCLPLLNLFICNENTTCNEAGNHDPFPPLPGVCSNKKGCDCIIIEIVGAHTAWSVSVS